MVDQSLLVDRFREIGKSSDNGTTISQLIIGVGVIGIGIMLATHYNTVSHGSTGQAVIDKQMMNYASVLGLFITITFAGIIFYQYLQSNVKQYALMFGLTMASLTLGYSALLASLYQVNI